MSLHAVQGTSSEPTVPTVPTIPGTSKQLSIVYYNARSLVPKFDELCASTETYKPDIILYALLRPGWTKDISDEELDIPGFMLHHKDRHRHGGGV